DSRGTEELRERCKARRAPARSETEKRQPERRLEHARVRPTSILSFRATRRHLGFARSFPIGASRCVWARSSARLGTRGTLKMRTTFAILVLGVLACNEHSNGKGSGSSAGDEATLERARAAIHALEKRDSDAVAACEADVQSCLAALPDGGDSGAC